jgi:hypothetical protein
LTLPAFTRILTSIMFVGHFAAGMAAKRIAPRVSLAWYFLAAQLLDLVWPVANVLGLERAALHYSVPTYNHLDLIETDYSHSLIMAFAWSVLFGLILGRVVRSMRAALVGGAAVLSHWLLDYLACTGSVPDAGSGDLDRNRRCRESFAGSAPGIASEGRACRLDQNALTG